MEHMNYDASTEALTDKGKDKRKRIIAHIVINDVLYQNRNLYRRG